ncbi:unnamed protein product [Rotaria socialis]
MQPLDRAQREFVEIPRSAYIRELRPIWLRSYRPPWFFDSCCDQRQVLISADLMFRAGDYILLPSLLWLCQIGLQELTNLSLEACIQKTNGFRFNLWYGLTHPDFISLPVLPRSPNPTINVSESNSMSQHDISSNVCSSDSSKSTLTEKLSLLNTSIGMKFTFLDLERPDIEHLTQVEKCVCDWLSTVGGWSSKPMKSIQSFFHIPPPDSPKSTLHLHLVSGRELDLERNHVFYRIPLSDLQNGKQPAFIVDLTRWEHERRMELVQLARSLHRMPRVYGISGCTCTGKSELAMGLSAKYPMDVIHQDDFHLPDAQLPRLSEEETSLLPNKWPQRSNIDRSHPLAVDWQALLNHIEGLKAKTEKKFILVEGNLLLSQSQMRNMLDRVVFIHVSEDRKEVIMQRRMARARPNSSSELEMNVAKEEYLPYFNSVWSKYQLYGQPYFQAYQIDFEKSTSNAILDLHSWFKDNIEEELTKCEHELDSELGHTQDMV